MKNTMSDSPLQSDASLLYHLRDFLEEQGVPWHKNILQHGKITLKDISLLQPLLTAWVQALPLQRTLVYKGGVWSMPSILLHSMFNIMALGGTGHIEEPGISTRSHLLWMTLLVNTMWQAASPDLQAQWAKGAKGPLAQGEKPNMTRTWLFWMARLHTYVLQQGYVLPPLAFPTTLALPETEGLFLPPYLFTNRKTKGGAKMVQELWEKDRALHPSLWGKPDLFTAEKLETVWAPFGADLPTKLPLTVERALMKAVRGELETQSHISSTLAYPLVFLVRTPLLRTLFPSCPSTEHQRRADRTLDTRVAAQQQLLTALDRWFQRHPEAQARWCAVKSGNETADTAWRRFWEKRFLESALPLCAEGESAPTTKRMRI